MTTLTLPRSQNTAQNATADVAPVEAVSASQGGERRPGLRLPLFVRSDQLYFWTREWQMGEAEALKEIKDGTVRRFSSGTDAAAWLLADDDQQ